MSGSEDKKPLAELPIHQETAIKFIPRFMDAFMAKAIKPDIATPEGSSFLNQLAGKMYQGAAGAMGPSEIKISEALQAQYEKAKLDKQTNAPDASAYAREQAEAEIIKLFAAGNKTVTVAELEAAANGFINKKVEATIAEELKKYPGLKREVISGIPSDWINLSLNNNDQIDPNSDETFLRTNEEIITEQEKAALAANSNKEANAPGKKGNNTPDPNAPITMADGAKLYTHKATLHEVQATDVNPGGAINKKSVVLSQIVSKNGKITWILKETGEILEDDEVQKVNGSYVVVLKPKEAPIPEIITASVNLQDMPAVADLLKNPEQMQKLFGELKKDPKKAAPLFEPIFDALLSQIGVGNEYVAKIKASGLYSGILEWFAGLIGGLIEQFAPMAKELQKFANTDLNKAIGNKDPTGGQLSGALGSFQQTAAKVANHPLVQILAHSAPANTNSDPGITVTYEIRNIAAEGQPEDRRIVIIYNKPDGDKTKKADEYMLDAGVSINANNEIVTTDGQPLILLLAEKQDNRIVQQRTVIRNTKDFTAFDKDYSLDNNPARKDIPGSVLQEATDYLSSRNPDIKANPSTTRSNYVLGGKADEKDSIIPL